MCSGMSQNDIGNVIGRRVAQYRRERNMSAERLAEGTDGLLSRSVIANLENGRKADLSVSQLVSLAEALRVPVANLLVGDPELEASLRYAQDLATDAWGTQRTFMHALVDLAQMIDDAGGVPESLREDIESTMRRTPLLQAVGAVYDVDIRAESVTDSRGPVLTEFVERIAVEGNIARAHIGAPPVERGEERSKWAREEAARLQQWMKHAVHEENIAMHDGEDVDDGEHQEAQTP